MSGPVSKDDTPPAPEGAAAPAGPVLEITPSRDTKVGRARVRRALPRRARRTVGSWCFVDHLGPMSLEEGGGIDIGPHPHIGLQTVTWLLEGEALHRDSLGSEQPLRPGQLNLMTAGRGVAHAEEGTSPSATGSVHGVQLWVAQPESTRTGAPAFEHHPELPRAAWDGVEATVLVGDLGGTASPARRDTDHVGADLVVTGRGGVVPLAAEHEHALVVFEGAIAVDGEVVEPGALAYLGEGRDELALSGAGRALLVGGVPFPDELVMWWNFVGRSRDEVDEARAAWQRRDEDRFAPVASVLDRIDAPRPPWSSGID
jgi:redox-sensitive bicupin YhaK (pirin superfamily)